MFKNGWKCGKLPVRENYVPVNRYSKYRYTGTKNTGRPKLRSPPMSPSSAKSYASCDDESARVGSERLHGFVDSPEDLEDL